MVKFTIPSRPDAVLMKRQEKEHMLFFINAVSILADTVDNIPERIGMIENGMERAEKLRDDALKMLEDLRVTIPEKQRANLANMGMDMSMRMVPKMSPMGENMLIPKENFRELVDAAKTKCGECALDNEECVKCQLFQVLSATLPLNRYDGVFLCPYNLAVWEGGKDDV